MSRGLDNCNPGNLRLSAVRYKGEIRPSRDRQFRTFESMAWGYRAIFVLLHTYSVRYKCKTLRSMVERYAPPVENDTDGYLRFVSMRAAVHPDCEVDTLDHRMMTAIVSAVSLIENGKPADPAAVEEGWNLYRRDF